MGELAKIIARAGVISSDMTVEFGKWGFPQEPIEVEPLSLEQLTAELEAVMSSEDMVAMKVTDLEVIKEWGSDLKKGTLHLEMEDGSKGDVEVLFGRAKTGDYILPWKSDTIKDVMCNGKTHLSVGDTAVYFMDLQELYFGNTKAFMLCRASTVEKTDGCS